MAGIIAMTLDGVLRSLTNGGALRSGILLYNALEPHASLAIITDMDTEEKATYWLAQNGLTKHSYLVLPKTEDPLDPGERRVIQIRRLKESSSVDFLIDPDPSVAQAVMASGTPVMLSLHPIYARPEFRPDFKSVAKPWDSLTQELIRQQDLRASDTREVETL
jgi:hypothetical protein